MSAIVHDCWYVSERYGSFSGLKLPNIELHAGNERSLPIMVVT